MIRFLLGRRILLITAAASCMLLLGPSRVAGQSDPRIDELVKNMRDLERRVQVLEEHNARQSWDRLFREHPEEYRKSQLRFAQDRSTYPGKQDEIEAIYVVTNPSPFTAQFRDAAVAALNKLLEQYPRANRTGCAVLNIAQMFGDDGKDNQIKKEAYLKLAIRQYSDSYFGNAVQVGAAARQSLGLLYRDNGRSAEAVALFDEIRKNYPDAVDSKGGLLVDSLPK